MRPETAATGHLRPRSGGWDLEFHEDLTAPNGFRNPYVTVLEIWCGAVPLRLLGASQQRLWTPDWLTLVEVETTSMTTRSTIEYRTGDNSNGDHRP